MYIQGRSEAVQEEQEEGLTNVAENKELQIPDGDSGSYFISHAAIVNADGTMKELLLLLHERGKTMPHGMTLTTTPARVVEGNESVDGFLISWFPTNRPFPREEPS